MKSLNQINSIGLRVKPLLRNAGLLAVVAASSFSLTGCFTIRHRQVSRTVKAPHVLDATLDDLNGQLARQFAAVQTINAKVNIQASTGGHHQGEVAEIPTFSGFILMRKPSDMRVIMLLPVVGSLALDMASDGKTFKLVIPPKKIAREGTEEVTKPSPKGFENLRPNIIREALQVPPVAADELVSLTEDTRVIPPASGRKESTEEPDYDLTISRVKIGNELQTVRVIHISRLTLRPYEQDIYDKAGRLVTIVMYDHYQKTGNIEFPMSIQINRPIDEYILKLDLTKLTLNQEMDDEQFALKLPDGIPVQQMN
jgi:hypothetical protein